MFSTNYKFNIGECKLILLEIPDKPNGPVANFRLIVLLPAARKLPTIITLDKIREKVETYVSPARAGFRPNRSKSDIVWTQWRPNRGGHGPSRP